MFSLYLDVRVVDEVLPDSLQVAGRQDPVGGHRHVLLPLLLHLLLAGPVPVQPEHVVEDVGRGQVDASAVNLYHSLWSLVIHLDMFALLHTVDNVAADLDQSCLQLKVLRDRASLDRDVGSHFESIYEQSLVVDSW